MRRPAACLLTLSALFLAVPEASAWTASTDSRVVRQAVRLMPMSLRGILEGHVEELELGVREAAAAEDEASPAHRQDPNQQGLCAATRIETLASEAVAMIDGHRPFAEVARQLGVMAHFVGDLNNPLQVSSADAREPIYARDYAEYVETNLERFPLVFYGWRDPALEPAGPGVRGFALQIADRSRRYYGHIGHAYAPDNPVPLASRFDVRSLPFGIGSLSYSHAVTDTARLWLDVWRRAHGDMGGTPYMGRELRAAAPPAAEPAPTTIRPPRKPVPAPPAAEPPVFTIRPPRKPAPSPPAPEPPPTPEPPPEAAPESAPKEAKGN